MTQPKKVLAKEKLSPEGIKYLEEQGFQVDLGLEWDADELLARIPEYHGLIIRSATKVTADVIQAGPGCRSWAAPASASTTSSQGGHQARRHRRQRAAEQRPLRRRAYGRSHHGLGPQHPPGPRRPQGRRVGEGQVGQERRRVARQDARRGRLGPYRLPRRRGRPRPRHERPRLRPVRAGGALRRARSRARRHPRQDLPRSRLHHRPSAQEPRDDRLHLGRGVRQDEGRRARRQCGPRRHHR